MSITMNGLDTKELSAYFTSEIARLKQEIEQREGPQAQNDDVEADWIDQGIEVQARFDNRALHEHQQWLLAQLQAAHQRLLDGVYGTCVDCGGNIPEERLEAIPHAIRCVPCQSQYDRSRSRRF